VCVAVLTHSLNYDVMWCAMWCCVSCTSLSLALHATCVAVRVAVCVAVTELWCHVLQRGATCCNEVQCGAVYVAHCCHSCRMQRVLQSVLQCVL